MLESTTKFEYKNINIDGLDTTKHNTHLNTFRKEGWIVFRSSPNAKLLNFNYSLKRPIPYKEKTL